MLLRAQILKTAFSKKRIDRYIEVDKLTKRSFQTNMEFLQFMKCAPTPPELVLELVLTHPELTRAEPS